ENRLAVEAEARELRKAIEALQAGAGTIIRQAQQLRERTAQLESLRNLLQERQNALVELVKRRAVALDRLESLHEQRYKSRLRTADELNAVLGPRIRIDVSRAGHFDAFSAAITSILRGSG